MGIGSGDGLQPLGNINATPSNTSGDIVTSHKVLVGVLFLVVVLALLVEGAGESHEWAKAVALLLLGPLLLLGMHNSTNLAAWAQGNPTQKGIS